MCSLLFHPILLVQAVTPPMPLYPPGVTPVVPGVPLPNATPATQLAQQVANEVSTKLQEAGQCSHLRRPTSLHFCIGERWRHWEGTR